MPEAQLSDYVKQQLLAGISRQEITQNLLSAGWGQAQIDEAFGPSFPVTEPIPAPQQPIASQIDAGVGVSQKSSRNKLIWVVPVLIFCIFAAVAGVFAYDFFFPTPQRVMQKMGAAMAKIKTAEYESKINLAISNSKSSKNSEDEKIEVGLGISGATDISDINNQKNSLDIKINADQISKDTIDVGVVSIGKIGYFKVDAGSSYLGTALTHLLGTQWVKTDYDKLADELPRLYPSLAESFEKDKVKNTPLTTKQLESLQALAQKTQIISIDKQFTDKSVNGVLCRHYSINISKKEMRKYIMGVGEILNDRITQQQTGMLADIVDDSTFSEVEMWVSKKDFTLRRVSGKMDSKYDLMGLAEFLISIDANFSYNKINEPVVIEAPQNAKDITDIIKSHDESMGDVRGKARDARRLSDMRQMVAAQEMYYGDEDRYYTCGTKGGDCGSKSNNWPAAVGVYMTKTPADPMNTGAICGQDYIYCGLDNTKNSDKFCYYTKLEATENYKYYTASHAGGFRRNTAPKTFEECTTEEIGAGGSSAVKGASPQSRDAYRMSDMRQLVTAEEMFYGDNDRYYTCGLKGGDCGGKLHYFPETVKPYINQKLADPLNDGNVCGQGYIYCGIDNTKEKEKFCFYAKLEGSGYYTASHAGNFKRATAPKTLDECARAN